MTRARIDIALVKRGFFESRARAQAAITAGLVTADGVMIRKPSELVDDTAQIEAQAPHPYVSRGGVKLAHALEQFRIDPRGRLCLDVGSSTGGFTDVLLKKGVSHVLAVDTGREQMHASLRHHPKVTLKEETDIRHLDSEQNDYRADMIVVDVSFIALRHVVPAFTRFAAPSCDLIALIKPQFEVGKKFLGKNGIVTDPAIQMQALNDNCDHLTAAGWQVQDHCDSPIAGGDGNREFLVYAAWKKS